jgi:phospholipase/carboxylesterase
MHSRRTFTSALAFTLLTTRLHAQNRMRARAVAPVDKPAPAGLHNLEIRDKRDTLVYIPESAAKFPKAPLVLSLHGATQNAERGIALLQTQADQHGFILVAPTSIETTWEIEGGWGEDFDNVDKSLALSFGLRNVDAARIAVAGFSDGASYALALGLQNGNLFNAVLGFSAGYIAEGTRTGKPPVFLSAGTQDPIFPIDSCGRAIARSLRSDGYSVTLREFDGRHTLPPDVAAEAMSWFMKTKT